MEGVEESHMKEKELLRKVDGWVLEKFMRHHMEYREFFEVRSMQRRR